MKLVRVSVIYKNLKWDMRQLGGGKWVKTYYLHMAIILSLMDVIFHHIGTI